MFKTKLFWTIAHIIAWIVAFIIIIIPLYNVDPALKPEYRIVKDLFTGEALAFKDIAIRFAISLILIAIPCNVIAANDADDNWSSDNFSLIYKE